MTEYQHDTIVPFKNSTVSKKEQVAEMFNRIAFRYDFLNRFLSAGIDRGWRKKAIHELAGIKPKTILDVATGTADMPIMLMQVLDANQITGIDISQAMMDIGKQKISKLGLDKKINLQTGDAEEMKFADASFDAVTVAFGVRNFQNLEKGLSEMLRVLRPGGKLVILECSKPTPALFLPLYKLYLRFIAPGIGQIVSGSSEAYRYLNDSVIAFPEGNVFLEILNKTGYQNTNLKKLNMGIATIYYGSKL